MRLFTERIAQLPPDKRKALELLLSNGASWQYQPLSRSAVDNRYPLSFAQRRMWFMQQMDPGASSYNMPGAIELKGNLNVVALDQSLTSIIERHEVLRATFHVENEEPVQVVSPLVRIGLPIVDLSGLSPEDQAECVGELRLNEAQRAFDLSRSPLVRATLLRLNGDEHILLVTMHHIVSDGGSVTIFIREMKLLYEAARMGVANPLPDLPIQYGDFAIWQHERIRGELLKNQIAYWKNQLAGAPDLLRLPRNRARANSGANRGATHNFKLPIKVSNALNGIASRQRATQFITLLAAFKTLLYSFSGEEDILVGSSVTNRTMVDVERLIGCFLNILPLRTDLSGDPGFLEVINKVREVVIAACAHSEIPFDKVVEVIRPERRPEHVPLVQALFEFAPGPAGQEPELSDLSVRLIKSGFGISKFDLTMFMSEGLDGFSGTVEYNADLFDVSMIEGLTTLFQLILENIASDPDQPISMLTRMSDANEEASKSAFNSRLN